MRGEGEGMSMYVVGGRVWDGAGWGKCVPVIVIFVYVCMYVMRISR